MISSKKRLQKVYENAKIIPCHSDSKFILMSDCHRGQGNTGDNFLPNQTLYFAALEYYYQNNFTYIELGDGDELWENRKMRPIVEVHSDAFWMISNFYKKNRFHMLFGNHDIVKRRKSYMSNHCENYFCDCAQCDVPLLPNIQASEGIILENTDKNIKIFLVHGHQVSILNDNLWPIARFLVRYIWRPLEMVGFRDPTGAGRPRHKREKIEKKLSSFANEKQQILIAGHTHRPVIPRPGKSLYFNDGSCVHPRCITGIEIADNKITLVKWFVRAKKDRSLYVAREVLEGPVNISSYY